MNMESKLELSHGYVQVPFVYEDKSFWDNILTKFCTPWPLQGEGCGANDFPGVYARVSAAQEWINEQICIWSCSKNLGLDCDPSINRCASNLAGSVNLTLTVIHDQYASEFAIIMEHVESATQYLFVDFKDYGNSVGDKDEPKVTTKNIQNQPAGTYYFLIADSARDGLCCNSGQGNITVTNDATGEVLWVHNGQFTDLIEMYIHVDVDGNKLWMNETKPLDMDSLQVVSANETSDECTEDNCVQTSVPKYDDPIYPGFNTTENATHQIMINIKYDKFPDDLDWSFDQYVGEILDGDSGSSIFTRSNIQNEGSWVAVMNQTSDGREETLESYLQLNLQSGLYRFNITDNNRDGLCCGNGYGWVTLTNSTHTVWSLPGDQMVDDHFAEALILVNDMGHTILASPEKDGSVTTSSGDLDVSPVEATPSPTTTEVVEATLPPTGSPSVSSGIGIGIGFSGGNPSPPPTPPYAGGQVENSAAVWVETGSKPPTAAPGFLNIPVAREEDP
jgi:hypothetical protein